MRDYAIKRGIYQNVQITTAMSILAYGIPPDAMNDYLNVTETTVKESLVRFCYAVIETLGEEYLRNQTVEDIT